MIRRRIQMEQEVGVGTTGPEQHCGKHHLFFRWKYWL